MYVVILIFIMFCIITIVVYHIKNKNTRNKDNVRIYDKDNKKGELQQWFDNTTTTFIPNLNIDDDTVLILSSHCSRTQFAEIQLKAVVSFCDFKYIYVILNDIDESRWTHEREDLNSFCTRNDIPCVNIPTDIHKHRYIIFPNTEEPENDHDCCRASDSFQIMFELAKSHGKKTLILDSDLVPFCPFTFSEVIKEKPFAAMPQSRGENVKYIWNAILLFDLEKMLFVEDVSFDCGLVDGHPVDTAGQFHHYFEKNNLDYNTVFTILKLTEPKNKHFLQYKESYPNTECIEDIFIHVRNGGNWEKKNEQEFIDKIQRFEDTIDTIINSYV